MGNLVQVFGQLGAGDLVMVEPSANLADGERVRARIVGAS